MGLPGAYPYCGALLGGSNLDYKYPTRLDVAYSDGDTNLLLDVINYSCKKFNSTGRRIVFPLKRENGWMPSQQELMHSKIHSNSNFMSDVSKDKIKMEREREEMFRDAVKLR